MTIELPEPIAGYFAADRTDSEAVAQFFTDDAIVIDEGATHRGRDAIKRWKEGASTKYQYVSEPQACEVEDGKVVVVSRLTGNFPGSPIDSRYQFSVAGGKIESLEIG